MSLERLKSVFPKNRKPLLAAALSLPLLGGAFAHHAHAGGWDAQAATTKPTTPVKTEFSVPLKDMRRYRTEVANTAAAKYSDDAIVVIYYGSNRDSIDAVRTGANMAKDEGFPVQGMIVAQGDESYKIYVDGLPVVNSVGELSESTPHWVRNGVVEGYRLMQDAQANVNRRKPTLSQN